MYFILVIYAMQGRIIKLLSYNWGQTNKKNIVTTQLVILNLVLNKVREQ